MRADTTSSAQPEKIMRNAITVLELIIGSVLLLGLAAYAAQGVLLMAQSVL